VKGRPEEGIEVTALCWQIAQCLSCQPWLRGRLGGWEGNELESHRYVWRKTQVTGMTGSCGLGWWLHQELEKIEDCLDCVCVGGDDECWRYVWHW
jgi:hypothetical protein